MQFLPFDYMAWAKRYQGSVRIDLSASGMPPPSPELFPLDPNWLSLKGATPELRGALKSRIAQTYGVAAENVLLAAGTSEANFLVCGALLEPGDGVLVERPAYQALTCLPTVFGARVERFPRVPEVDWAIDLERIASAWRPDTRLLLLSTPHNPTGVATPSAQLAALGDWLQARDAYALVDEVYRDFVPDAGPVAQALHPRLITTASLTKVYGLSALRAGWALAPPEIVRRAEQLYDLMAVNPPTASLHAALAAFEARPGLLAHAWERAAANREQLTCFLNELPDLACSLPHQGIIALLQLPANKSATALIEQMRVECDTLAVPGDFFEAPGWIRLAYGAEPAIVAEGLSHFRRILGGAS
jgi:aspartate/methionine/tyrosine aminotransferase